MSLSKVAYRYSKTLFQKAKEDSSVLESVAADLSLMKNTFEKNQNLVEALNHPLISGKKIEAAVLELFQGKVNELTTKFIKLLAFKKRLAVLPKVPESFMELYEKEKKIVRVLVTSAQKLDGDQLTKLESGIKSTVTANQILIENKVDAELIAGFQIRVQDTVIDANVKYKLNQLKRKLAA